MESVVEKPYILMTDYRLTEVNDILPAMNLMADKKLTNLILICDNIEQNALATAIVNRMQGKFNLIAINKPSDETAMDDIALLTGAKMFSEKKGDKLDEIKIEDFGHAERVIVREKETMIVGPKGNKKAVDKAISALKFAIGITQKENEKDKIKRRLAFFINKVAVVKVGAATENEVNALRYKIDDAVNSTHAAFKNGVVCGGGLSLARIKTSSEILNAALQAPFRQLKRNMGIEKHRELKENEALNVVSGKIGNFMSVGVMDPVDVLIAQVESAVSIAGLLITTSGMIVEPPKHIKEEN
jgi:chaperonin GroEL